MSMFPGLSENPRCCAYLRKSRKDMERERYGDGDTLAHHRAIIARTAEFNGHEITEWFEEVVSGETIADRPKMTELLRQVARGEWDAIYAMEPQRLSRGGGSDQELVTNALSLTGTWLFTPSGPYDPSSDRDAKALKQELRGGEDELGWIKARLMRGREQAIREGCWINTATVPYGWKSERIDGKYQLVPKEGEHETLRMVWDMVESGMGFAEVARKLESMGIPTSRGGKMWTGTHIRNMLVNRAHCGYTFYGLERDVKALDPDTLDVTKVVDRSKSNYIEARGLWYDKCQSGEWGVTEERYDKMRPLLAANAKTKVGLQMRNPLSGILKCSKCGRVMTLKRKKRNDGSVYEYYTHNERGRQTDGCTCKCASKADVMGILSASLLSAACEAELSFSGTGERESARKALEASLKSATDAIGRIMDAYEDGAYTVAEFRERKAAAERRAEAAREELKALEAEDPGKGLESAAGLRDCVAKLGDESVSGSKKNADLKRLVERVDYSRDDEGIHLDVFLRR